MLPDPAGENTACPEVPAGNIERDKGHVGSKRPVPVELGAWQAYLNKVLPPLPDHP